MLKLFLDRSYAKNGCSSKKLIYSFLLVVFILQSFNCSYSHSEQKKESREAIIITANMLTADNELNRAIFEGSVKAVKGDLILYADKMIVSYQNEKAGRGIKKINAEGNVKLIKNERIVTASSAEYNDFDETVVFTGEPRATDGKTVITGTKMTYSLRQDRYWVENSKVITEQIRLKNKGEIK